MILSLARSKSSIATTFTVSACGEQGSFVNKVSQVSAGKPGCPRARISSSTSAPTGFFSCELSKSAHGRGYQEAERQLVCRNGPDAIKPDPKRQDGWLQQSHNTRASIEAVHFHKHLVKCLFFSSLPPPKPAPL